MGPLIITSIVLVIVLAGIMSYLFFFRKIVTKNKLDNELTIPEKKNGSELIKDNDAELSIQFEEITALTETEEAALVEIKDAGLIAKIDNVIPGAIQAVANGGTVKNYQQAAKEAGQLYRAKIPKGAHLVNAKREKRCCSRLLSR